MLTFLIRVFGLEQFQATFLQSPSSGEIVNKSLTYLYDLLPLRLYEYPISHQMLESQTFALNLARALSFCPDNIILVTQNYSCTIKNSLYPNQKLHSRLKSPSAKTKNFMNKYCDCPVLEGGTCNLCTSMVIDVKFLTESGEIQ